MPHPVAVNIRVTLRDDLARRIDRTCRTATPRCVR